MAVNSSIQQLSGGIASAVAGLIVAQDTAGRLRHFDILGFVVVASMIGAVTLLYAVNRNVAAARFAANAAAATLPRAAAE
jgi:hypothetical protein